MHGSRFPAIFVWNRRPLRWNEKGDISATNRCRVNAWRRPAPAIFFLTRFPLAPRPNSRRNPFQNSLVDSSDVTKARRATIMIILERIWKKKKSLKHLINVYLQRQWSAKKASMNGKNESTSLKTGSVRNEGEAQRYSLNSLNSLAISSWNCHGFENYNGWFMQTR